MINICHFMFKYCKKIFSNKIQQNKFKRHQMSTRDCIYILSGYVDLLAQKPFPTKGGMQNYMGYLKSDQGSRGLPFLTNSNSSRTEFCIGVEMLALIRLDRDKIGDRLLRNFQDTGGGGGVNIGGLDREEVPKLVVRDLPHFFGQIFAQNCLQ
eukprot:TRINITY_DN48172_c0_g1_i2.p3 TRINITY_DN48172_c0_g1~~TRINITY_DN48172_c0_g1_i2.p3  ORF type:complete len:153 (-),score=0.52 TRINITY_DN48172_c0_g1_i2:51-509(-)